MFCGFFLVLTGTAHADWHKAESEHFVIYSDSRAGDVEQFATMLERYHAAMVLETGRKIETPSPSSRVTVFAVGSDRNLKELYGNRNSNVAGFYMARASGSVAFVPNIKMGRADEDFSLTILLHEYAHHFLISTSRHAMPRWLSEGAAEYFASARFPKDGSVKIGLPNRHRAGELKYAADVSLRELLDHELYDKRRSRRYNSFYGKSWLLFHYLAFNKPRAGQLQTYWRAIAGGVPSTEAAEKVFGDLDQLEKELKSYAKMRRGAGFQWNAESISIGDVSVSKLTDGMDAMMPVMLQSKRGVDEEEAAELIAEARLVAAKYPNDAGVLAALAEAEYDANNDQQAIAAADRAIAADPGTKNAYVQKGLALFRIAEDADDQDGAFAAAMKPFGALNQLENDHVLPLMYYYRSFTNRGAVPPESARHALERASQLAPFDKGLVMDVALMQAQEGQVGLAAYTLAPVAANPHGGSRANAAKALIRAFRNAEEGKSFDPRNTLNAARAAEASEEEDAGEGSGDDTGEDGSGDGEADENIELAPLG